MASFSPNGPQQLAAPIASHELNQYQAHALVSEPVKATIPAYVAQAFKQDQALDVWFQWIPFTGPPQMAQAYQIDKHTWRFSRFAAKFRALPDDCRSFSNLSTSSQSVSPLGQTMVPASGPAPAWIFVFI